MAIHLIGAGARSLFDVASKCSYESTFRVRVRPGLEGTLDHARVACPRKGEIDGTYCGDCRYFVEWRSGKDAGLTCSGSDADPVTDWMRRPDTATTVETRCPAADELAARRGVHHLLAFDRSLSLAGIVCRCDLARGGDGPVGAVMSSDVFAVTPATTIGQAATIMRQLRIGCLPVVSGALVLGVLTRRDLDRAGVPRQGATTS